LAPFHTLSLYQINIGISGMCSLDDSGQKIDTQFPLTTKSASRVPLSVQRKTRAQSGTGIPEPCCATWVAMSGSAHSSFENPLQG